MPVTTFPDLLLHNLEHRHDADAVVYRDEVLSFADVAEQVRRLADTLVRQGVVPGDRVLVHLPPGPDEVTALFAIAMVGAVFVNVHHHWKPEQVDYVAQDCEPRAMVTDMLRLRPLLSAGVIANVPHIVVRGKLPDDPRALAWPGDEANLLEHPVAIDPQSLCALIYTSGSTGRPKGVMLSHHNLVSGAHIVCEFMHNRPSDRLIGVLPLCFVYGLSQLTSTFCAGGAYVVQHVAMPSEIVKTMKASKVTGMCAVPPLWLEVLSLLDARPETFPDLRFVASSGGAPPPALLDGLPKAFPGIDIYLMYGLTEAFRSAYLPPHLYETKRGSIGRATPRNELYIIDDEHGICGPGQQGELIHRGPVVCMGYWRNEEYSAQRIKPCPQLAERIGDEKVAYSGDIVRIDDDGDLWFVGRKDLMIKRRGFRISPTEVEDIVGRHPQVDEAICFGVKDAELVQHVHVALSGSSIDLDSLRQFCRKLMPSYMLPSAFHVWDGPMPRTVNGKLDRRTVTLALTQTTSETTSETTT